MISKQIVILALLLPVFLQAQTILNGKTYTAEGSIALPNTSVTNLNTRKSTMSDKDARYFITAKVGDSIAFYHVGFRVDTVSVGEGLLQSGYDAYLRDHAPMLETVKVIAGYHIDSINRRKEYSKIYNTETRITGGNTPQEGFGIVLSPFSYFSKGGRQTRMLKRRLKSEEKDYYIDAVFSATMVSRITGLKNDSLRYFMYRYRPTYLFCRQQDHAEMVVYINDKYKEFINPQKNNAER